MEIKNILKTVGMWIIILGDLALVIFIIDLISIKSFGKFTLGYFLGLIIMTIILGKLGIMSSKVWKSDYELNIYSRTKHLKPVGSVFLVFISLVSVYFLGNPFYVGITSGILITYYFAKFCKGSLYSIEFMVEQMEKTLQKKYSRWLK